MKHYLRTIKICIEDKFYIACICFYILTFCSFNLLTLKKLRILLFCSGFRVGQQQSRLQGLQTIVRRRTVAQPTLRNFAFVKNACKYYQVIFTENKLIPQII